MSLIKVENLSSIETEVVKKPSDVPINKWVENIQKYTGSTLRDDTLKWLAFVKHTSSEIFTPSFKIDGVLDVDFNAARYRDELVHIVNGLIKRGQYKKYAGVWNWIPEIQEMVLSTDWKSKNSKQTKSKILAKSPRRPSPSYIFNTIDSGLEQTLRRAARGAIIRRSGWESITFTGSAPSNISDETLSNFHNYFITRTQVPLESSATDMEIGVPSIRREDSVSFGPSSQEIERRIQDASYIHHDDASREAQEDHPTQWMD